MLQRSVLQCACWHKLYDNKDASRFTAATTNIADSELEGDVALMKKLLIEASFKSDDGSGDEITRRIIENGYDCEFLATADLDEIREAAAALKLSREQTASFEGACKKMRTARAADSYMKCQFKTPTHVGKRCAYKRVLMVVATSRRLERRATSHSSAVPRGRYGIARDTKTHCAQQAEVLFDDGSTGICNRHDISRGIKACARLNARRWRRIESFSLEKGHPDLVTEQGRYPIFLGEKCVSPWFGHILEKEIAGLKQRYTWELYFGGSATDDDIGYEADSRKGLKQSPLQTSDNCPETDKKEKNREANGHVSENSNNSKNDTKNMAPCPQENGSSRGAILPEGTSTRQQQQQQQPRNITAPAVSRTGTSAASAAWKPTTTSSPSVSASLASSSSSSHGIPNTSSSSSSKVMALYCLHRWDRECLPFQNPCDLGIDKQWAPPPSYNHTAMKATGPNTTDEHKHGEGNGSGEGGEDDENGIFARSRTGKTLSGAFVSMPSAIRWLRCLLLQGNPEVVRCFSISGIEQHVYGIAAVMTYRHENEVGDGLAWHYDKSIGIETACISVPQGGKGHKIVGIGGRAPIEGQCDLSTNTPFRLPIYSVIYSHKGANAEDYRVMNVPVNSYWGGNAHAVFHAVGNKDNRSATIVYRTLLTHVAYNKGSASGNPFMPNGARAITRALKKIMVRYFPDLDDEDEYRNVYSATE
eukprot:jgi/Bigna1/89663/estExt_fgenesh1_pg.C_530055